MLVIYVLYLSSLNTAVRLTVLSLNNDGPTPYWLTQLGNCEWDGCVEEVLS